MIQNQSTEDAILKSIEDAHHAPGYVYDPTTGYAWWLLAAIWLLMLIGACYIANLLFKGLKRYLRRRRKTYTLQ